MDVLILRSTPAQNVKFDMRCEEGIIYCVFNIHWQQISKEWRQAGACSALNLIADFSHQILELIDREGEEWSLA